MTTTTRREFLRLTSAAGGALGLASCGAGPSAVAPDASGSVDARADGSTCAPTQADVVGPFYEPGAPIRAEIAGPDEPGERLTVDGVVLADDCATPIEGALLDVWQADRDGEYHGADEQFRLRGKVVTGADGRFSLSTVRPGNYENGDLGLRPAHLHVTVTKRGFVSVTTQIYFSDDPHLSPNDSCAQCGSDDPARILELAGNAVQGWRGELRLVLAPA